MSEMKILGTATAGNLGGTYRTPVKTDHHQFIADEPIEVGGNAEGPAPIDFLCMALASCKAITIRMYANRKGWKLDSVHVNVNFVKGTGLPSGNNTFFCSLKLDGELSDDQVKRILQISKACPVDRLLIKPSEVITEVV